MRALPFSEQYPAWQRALWRLGKGEGPVDVLHTRGDVLLAAWFASAKAPCLESLLQRAGGDRLIALRVCDAVQALPHSDSKRRALDRTSRALREWGLPARGVKVIRWPQEAGKLRDTGLLERVRERLTARGRRLWHWVRSRTRVVLPKRQTYASRWNHIQTVKRSEMSSLLDGGLGTALPEPADQLGMARLKRYWRFPVQAPPERALGQGCAEVEAWARRNFGKEYRRCDRATVGPLRGRSGGRGSRDPDPCPSELESYVACLARPGPGEVLVQEDKDKTAAWRMPAQLYLHWVAYLLRSDHKHWQRADVTVPEICNLYRSLHRDKLPRRLKYMAGADRWARFRLNYMYMNLKAKCFGDCAGRTCTKDGHSCLRKVVSWCSHPAVDYYRWVARGVQTLVSTWGRGFEVASLKTAVSDLRSRVAELEAPETSCCRRCARSMCGPSVLVADAAQMYEEVPPSRVSEGLETLVAWAVEKGYVGVVVSRRQGASSYLAKQAWRHPPGTELFTWEELVTGVRLALAQSVVSVGDSVWRQAEGLPIGGPHSPACCSVVLGVDEAAWAEDADRRCRLGFDPQGSELSRQAALARYVDDLIVVSRIWCPECLESMVGFIYRKPVQFDKQPTTPLGQPWLDAWIAFRGGELVIRMDGQEQDWVECRGASPPSKMRLKPYLGDEACSWDALRLHVSARAARLRQAGLGDEELRKAVEREVLILTLHGYPRDLMCRAWSRCPQYPAASQHARFILKTWQQAFPRLTRFVPDWTWRERVAEEWLPLPGQWDRWGASEQG